MKCVSDGQIFGIYILNFDHLKWCNTDGVSQNRDPVTQIKKSLSRDITYIWQYIEGYNLQCYMFKLRTICKPKKAGN